MLSPQAFEVPAAQLNAALKGKPKRAAVAGAETEVALKSTRQARRRGSIDPALVGDGPAIGAMAKKIGSDIGAVEVVGTEDEAMTSKVAVGLAR